MEIKQLIERAKEVRGKYAELEKRKFGKEWTTAQIMEGFVVDVGDLMKLVMQKQGIRPTDDTDNKLAHELSDCLWCILVLSYKYNIDIEASFLQTMAELEEKIKQSISN